MFDQGVGILALQKIRALIPVAIISDIWALFQIVKVEVWWSPKILLPMSIVAFTPFVLFVDVGTKTSFV